MVSNFHKYNMVITFSHTSKRSGTRDRDWYITYDQSDYHHPIRIFHSAFTHVSTKTFYHKIQAGHVLHYLFLQDFAVMRLENLHHFSNLCDNFWFNAIWQTQYILEASRK